MPEYWHPDPLPVGQIVRVRLSGECPGLIEEPGVRGAHWTECVDADGQPIKLASIGCVVSFRDAYQNLDGHGYVVQMGCHGEHRCYARTELVRVND